MGIIALVAQIPAGCDSGTGDNSELDNFFANHPYVSDPRTGIRSTVSISPASATVNTAGGQAVFSLIGGNEPITWTVSNTGVGSISGHGGSATYTATSVGQNDVIAYDRDGNAAIASINGSSGGSSGGDLGVSATPSSLGSNGSMSVLKATGGIPPYSWTVASGPKGGFVDGDTGVTVVYIRNLAGDNAVTVTDSIGAKASIVISQP